MKRKRILTAVCAAWAALAVGMGAQAAAADDAVTEAYDKAVKVEDRLDSFDATVNETVSIAGQSSAAQKTIHIQVSGMHSDDEDDFEVAIDVQTPEGEKQQYYKDGYFYSNQSGSNMKYAMKKKVMKELLNYYIYLHFDSGYLSMLTATDNPDGSVAYEFAATQETVADYEDKLLEGAQEEHKISIASLQGTVDVNAAGEITERRIEMAYTVNSGGQGQLCILNSDAVFNETENVTVSFPDLSGWGEKTESEAVTGITQVSQTLYATADVNVRAQNNVTSAVLGGIAAGDTMQETGYTDDGWIQISYNGVSAYVSGNYVSATKPVIVKAMSGTMYATASVHVRDTYSTDGNILGSLSSGEAISTTGYTDNNWIQVSYGGKTGYVSASYLTWDAPVTYTDGYIEGTLTDATMNGLTLVTSSGATYYFYTEGAEKNTVDGLVVGDWIGVYYTSDGSSDSAYQIDDYNDHDYSSSGSGNVMNDNNYDDGYKDMSSYGTVIAYGMSAVTVALDNGITLSADKDSVEINGSLYEGAYVLVNYIGDYMYQITAV